MSRKGGNWEPILSNTSSIGSNGSGKCSMINSRIAQRCFGRAISMSRRSRSMFTIPNGFLGIRTIIRKIWEALKEVRDWGFTDLFRKFHPNEEGQFTFWDYRVPSSFERNLGWRVDHIYVTKSLAEKAKACWIDKEPRTMEKPSDHTILVGEFRD